MKIKNLTGAPPFVAQFGPASGVTLTLTSPLLLASHPTNPLQAATKQYADTSKININAEKITTGTLHANRFPNFTGDVVKLEGYFTISLTERNRISAPNQTVAGTYTRFDVNAKGLVEDGTTLLVTDIPNLSWGKITSGLPKSLTGYGITDALAKTGGTLTNFLSITNNPTANLHASNKQYADTKVSSVPKYATGDIMVRPSTSTPSGFLRCNGGDLSKTTYSALYAVIGDTHTVAHQPGNGRPWQQQYEINKANPGALAWGSHSTLGYYIAPKSAVVLKNKVYLTNINNTATMGYVNTIDANGVLSSTWDSTNILPLPSGSRLNCMFLVAKNRLYLMGGYDNNTGNMRNDVFSASIDSNGNIGAWVTQPSLPGGVKLGGAIYTKDRIYIFGGDINGTAISTVYTTVVNSDGSLNAWTTGTALPFANSVFAYAVVKNRVYVFGGYNSVSGYLNTVIYAPINVDGTLGTWTTSSALPIKSALNDAYVTQNKVYLFVNYNGTSRTSGIVSAAINADGSLGSWNSEASLVGPLDYPNIIATTSKLYAVGMANGSSPTCYVSSFTGGLNDYSAYYNGSILPTPESSFRLPDYSTKETRGMRYFVKT